VKDKEEMEGDWREGLSCPFEQLVKFAAMNPDVTFSVGEEGQEEEIKTSTFILSSLSPVFEAMFNETWKGQEKIIPLPDIQPKVFRIFLKVTKALQITKHVCHKS